MVFTMTVLEYLRGQSILGPVKKLDSESFPSRQSKLAGFKWLFSQQVLKLTAFAPLKCSILT